MSCAEVFASINPFKSTKLHKAFMCNVTLTLLVGENGAKYHFEWLQILFCKAAPYRIKNFTISQLNEMCK